MIEIKEEDIILDWKGMDEIHIFYTEKQLGKQLKQQILQDHELRKEIVDLADFWDGKESIKYGKVLMRILDKLGIKDIPEFYSEKNITKIIQKIKDRQIVMRLEKRIKELQKETVEPYTSMEVDLQKILDGEENEKPLEGGVS